MQVLGCSNPKFPIEVEAILIVRQGKFHSVSLTYESKLPTYILEDESIKKINREGVTIFLVEQNAKKALENSDIGYVMDMGNISFEGNSEDLLNDNSVRMSYLGGKGNKDGVITNNCGG